MVRTVEQLYLQVEVVGCPTVCRHCWAQGVPYQAMPLDDVAWVLEQTHAFCDQHGLGFDADPMHELAAHPQAAEILRLFAGHVGAAEFEPLATTGVPLATRTDWRQPPGLARPRCGSPSTASAPSTTARSTAPAPGPRRAWRSSASTPPGCAPAATSS